MRKVVFLDRDGVLNLDRGYTYKIEDYKLLDGVKEGLKKLVDAGFDLIILTSQSGIGRGMYKEKDYQKYMEKMYADFALARIPIAATYFCPHHAEHGIGEYKKDCQCRKPKPGLVRMAEKTHGPFDYAHSWAIGDSTRDLEIATNSHPAVKTVLIPKNFGTEFEEPMEETDAKTFKAKNFLGAVEIVLRESERL